MRVVGKSNYTGVSVYQKDTGEIVYTGRVKPTEKVKGHMRSFDTEKEAAMAVDLWLIEQSKDPVNILKRI